MSAPVSPANGFTVDDVVDACRSLPEPAWHRIVAHHPQPRMAAVLLPVVDVDGAAGVVVTKRAGALAHGGDWVFPGGGVDDGDVSHLEAARREAAEELGVDADQIAVIGQLATRGPIISGYVIETYVGVLDPTATLRPAAREVVDVAIIPIAALLDADGHHRGPPALHRTTEVPEGVSFVPDLSQLRHYRVRDDEHLWGLQADLLHELLVHLTAGRHDF